MIQYETADSPFFEANKRYCESIETGLYEMNLDCSGFCNCYGFSIEASMKRNDLSYNLKFLKYQTTQNGVVVPVGANNSEETEVTVSGLNKLLSINAGQSSLRRLFTPNYIKDKMPRPYYINCNYTPDKAFVDYLIENVRNNRISKFKLSNGTMVCQTRKAELNPWNLIEDIEKMAMNCL